ncbi:MAG: outer membrane beta-barrel protein [Alistipes sp.]
MRRLLYIGIFIFFVCGSSSVQAQHTLGVNVGYGMGTAALYPRQETKGLWGLYSGGVSWRYYGTTRFVGGLGIDLEFVQQAFSFAPYASTTENEADYQYYTRRLNSIMVPFVWQPHIYLFHNKLRIYVEAAATFSYNLSSTYENELVKADDPTGWKGTYRNKVVRDNRWGYGLAGGGGFAVLIKQWEINVRARYYFGFSDIVRNRNKYADNTLDGPENPFWLSPLRSPLNNLTISIGLAYRFNKEGFKEWTVPRHKREKNKETFNYKAK